MSVVPKAASPVSTSVTTGKTRSVMLFTLGQGKSIDSHERSKIPRDKLDFLRTAKLA